MVPQDVFHPWMFDRPLSGGFVALSEHHTSKLPRNHLMWDSLSLRAFASSLTAISLSAALTCQMNPSPQDDASAAVRLGDHWNIFSGTVRQVAALWTYSGYSNAHGRRLPWESKARSSKGTPWNWVGRPIRSLVAAIRELAMNCSGRGKKFIQLQRWFEV